MWTSPRGSSDLEVEGGEGGDEALGFERDGDDLGTSYRSGRGTSCGSRKVRVKDVHSNFNDGNPPTTLWVSSETVMTCPINLRMYLGSSGRLGSLTMPERGSVETRYWSMTHSRAERLPRR